MSQDSRPPKDWPLPNGPRLVDQTLGRGAASWCSLELTTRPISDAPSGPPNRPERPLSPPLDEVAQRSSPSHWPPKLQLQIASTTTASVSWKATFYSQRVEEEILALSSGFVARFLEMRKEWKSSDRT